MRAALAQWAVSYKRATWLQAPRSDLSLPSLLGYRERARGGSLLAS
jgi:hypothetical protein